MGMTSAHEATLFGECKIPYCIVALVDNMANGIGEKLSIEGFKQLQQENAKKASDLVAAVVSGLIKFQPAEPEFDTVVHARYVVTVDEKNSILENHSVAIKDGKIVSILEQAKAKQEWAGKSKETVNLPQSVLMPGLINTHTHSPMVLLRGFGDDMKLEEWLSTRIWPAEMKCVSAEFVREGCLLSMAEMIRGGTTCFNDMYFFPEELAACVDKVGMRATIGLILIQFPSAYGTGYKYTYMYIYLCSYLYIFFVYIYE